MHLCDLVQNSTFRTASEVREAIRRACVENADIAEFRTLGYSDAGRPLEAVILGRGECTVSLVAGAHADEPVGPETLRVLILNGLQQRHQLEDIFQRFTLVIIPHINPDGEEKNLSWMRRWPDAAAYIRHAIRELPGRDIEFGYPDMRTENRQAAELWGTFAPFALHMSLHGMGFSEGAMLLIERHSIVRTEALRRQFTIEATRLGMRLHDHDRGGEKGFSYIGPGFTTTPAGRAMQAHFLARNDPETAAKFHLSSMEYIRTLGDDPLCLVTELPLFVIENQSREYRGVPDRYQAFKAKLPMLRMALEKDDDIVDAITEFGLQPLELTTAVRFQLSVIEWGLAAAVV